MRAPWNWRANTYMCGIAGLIDLQSEITIGPMLESIEHRGETIRESGVPARLTIMAEKYR